MAPALRVPIGQLHPDHGLVEVNVFEHVLRLSVRQLVPFRVLLLRDAVRLCDGRIFITKYESAIADCSSSCPVNVAKFTMR